MFTNCVSNFILYRIVKSVSVIDAYLVIIVFVHKKMLLTLHEFLKDVHVQRIIVALSVVLFFLVLLGQHILQRGLKQVFEIRFGNHV
jgi:hypothetical protein